ncbi:MAG: CHAD domain-containing protein, partial [Proteobacteria bacterium]|nr:CHAD domain-containing protein [Pseudomonadota bacterium]
MIRIQGEPVAIPALSKEPSAGEIINVAIAKSVARLIELLPQVYLSADVEMIHRSRVATRRLRSDLRTFGPLLDRRWAEDLRRSLRGPADDLGRIRDADVLEAQIVT